jgi:hypothetical protein
MVFPSTSVKAILLTIALLSLLLVSPARLNIWRLDGDSFSRVPNEEGFDGSHEIINSFSADLDGNGVVECLMVEEDSTAITDCRGGVLWRSPESWQIKQAFTSDLNRDGVHEVTLLVWRPFSPWPIDRFLTHGGRISEFHGRDGMSCQVILIGWKGSEYGELWAGSSLIRPLTQLTAVDLDGDGGQELVALEGYYDRGNSGATLTAWRWRGFGFVLLDEVDQQFIVIKVLENSNQVWIVAR